MLSKFTVWMGAVAGVSLPSKVAWVSQFSPSMEVCTYHLSGLLLSQ